MSDDTTEVVEIAPRARSRASNGRVFGAVDGRLTGARRFRDLCLAFCAEIGVMIDALPASGQQTIRRLAQLTVELELMEATRASGEAIDGLTYITAVNTQRRLLRDLVALGDRHAAGGFDDLVEEGEDGDGEPDLQPV